MEFPHNCGSLLLPFKEIAACMFVSKKPFMNGQCPGWIPPLSPWMSFRDMKGFLYFLKKNKNTHPSVCLSCFQCANRASTSPRWEIWSVQNVRRIVSLTTRGRCSVAVKKTTSVLKETLCLWLVPVSVYLFIFFTSQLTDPTFLPSASCFLFHSWWITLAIFLKCPTKCINTQNYLLSSWRYV